MWASRLSSCCRAIHCHSTLCQNVTFCLRLPGDHCSVTCPDGFVSMGKYQPLVRRKTMEHSYGSDGSHGHPEPSHLEHSKYPKCQTYLFSATLVYFVHLETDAKKVDQSDLWKVDPISFCPLSVVFLSSFRLRLPFQVFELPGLRIAGGLRLVSTRGSWRSHHRSRRCR